MNEILQSIQSSRPWEVFWRGEQPALLVNPDGVVVSGMPRSVGILPGSFNPLHEGHRKLAETASRILGADVLFELSVKNVDKSTIEPAEVLRRIGQFIGYRSIAITRADTFLVKAALFSGCYFVVGYDTAERIISPRYYSDEAAMYAALKTIAASGCSFLVACRALNGELKCLEDLDLPSEIAPLFSSIPANIFRFDLSSTELRKRG
jgi:cytidyltransferase-like protein